MSKDRMRERERERERESMHEFQRGGKQLRFTYAYVDQRRNLFIPFFFIAGNCLAHIHIFKTESLTMNTFHSSHHWGNFQEN